MVNGLVVPFNSTHMRLFLFCNVARPYPCISIFVNYATVLEIVRQAVPSKAAWKIFLTGKVFDAKEAQTFGVVDEIVPADQLLARAIQVCNEVTVLL